MFGFWSSNIVKNAETHKGKQISAKIVFDNLWQTHKHLRDSLVFFDGYFSGNTQKIGRESTDSIRNLLKSKIAAAFSTDIFIL